MKKAMLGLGIALLAATTLYITYYLVNNDFDDRSSADSGNGYWGCYDEGKVSEPRSCTKTTQDKRGRKVTTKGTKIGYCRRISQADNSYRLDWSWGSCN